MQPIIPIPIPSLTIISSVHFQSINLNAAGFQIHGNPVLLINQLSGTYFGGQSTFGPSIRLADGAFPNFLKLNDPAGSLIVSGEIDLNGTKLTLITTRCILRLQVAPNRRRWELQLARPPT